MCPGELGRRAEEDGDRDEPPVPTEATHPVSRLLAQVSRGQGSATAVLPLVYRELRAIAGDLMRRERDDHTLQPTALVHEAFVRLLRQDADLGVQRVEFLAVAAQAMRNLLVDHARKHRAEKRGGARDRVTLGGVEAEAGVAPTEVDVLDLHAALDELEELDPRQAQVVEMAFFAGMTGQEIADHLGVHRNTVLRDLRMARAWLRRALSRGGAASDASDTSDDPDDP